MHPNIVYNSVELALIGGNVIRNRVGVDKSIREYPDLVQVSFDWRFPFNDTGLLHNFSGQFLEPPRVAD